VIFSFEVLLVKFADESAFEILNYDTKKALRFGFRLWMHDSETRHFLNKNPQQIQVGGFID
jgi:hypothetical protein